MKLYDLSTLAKKFGHFFADHGKTLSSFGAMQAMQIVLPLLALPLLARRLGPDAFGLLMFFCLIPPLVALLTDFGLALGGARSAAAARGDHAAIGRLLAAACASRLILLAAVAVLALLLWPLLPYASQYPAAYMLATLAGMARGLNPTWLFQGIACGVSVMALLDVVASLVVLLLVCLCIHTPASWPLYLFFLALCKALAYGCAYHRLRRRYGAALDFRGGISLLKKCAPLCGSAFSLMFAYNGSQIILGFFLPPADMGILGAVNKMLRALGSLINPFTMTLFPEICIWRRNDAARACRALRISLAFTAMGAVLAATLAALTAPWLIRIALGSDYAAAIPALRLALLATPAMACNNVLGQQALVPFGHDKSLLAVQGTAAALGLPLAALQGCFWGLYGGALLPVCMEFIMLIGLITAVGRRCPQAFVNPGQRRR